MDSAGESGQIDDGLKDSRHEQADLLLDEHWCALCRYARVRVRDQASVEDVVQETLLAALRELERFRDDSTVRTWLIGILRHKIADHWRQINRRELTESDQVVEALFDGGGLWRQSPGDWTVDPTQLAENGEFWEVLGQCLAKLPTQPRSVFAMRVLDEISSEDVCKALEISATNLWVLLHRARLRLRECLEKNWFLDD